MFQKSTGSQWDLINTLFLLVKFLFLLNEKNLYSYFMPFNAD